MKLRTTIAVLFVLIFGLLTVPTFFIRSIVKTYLNPVFYEGPVVEESHTYLISFLQKSVKEDRIVAEYFNDTDIEQLVQKYFPIEALREIIQDFITQMNNITEGRKSNDIMLSLLPLKQNIPQMAGDIASKIIENTPTCPEDIEDIADIEIVDGVPSCLLPDSNLAALENPLKREIENNLTDLIPGEFSLDLENGDAAGGSEFKQLLYIFKYAQMILPLFMLIIILLMSLIIYKPYTKIIKFIGGSFVLGGVFALAAGQLFLQLPSGVINTQAFPEMLEAELNEAVGFYSFLIQFIVDKVTVYSLYFIGIGALVILIGLYLSHYYENHTQYDS